MTCHAGLPVLLRFAPDVVQRPLIQQVSQQDVAGQPYAYAQVVLAQVGACPAQSETYGVQPGSDPKSREAIDNGLAIPGVPQQLLPPMGLAVDDDRIASP